MRGGFVTAHSKRVRKRDDDKIAEVHILRGLARIGVAAIIDNEPRGVYPNIDNLSMIKLYENWKAKQREKNPP